MNNLRVLIIVLLASPIISGCQKSDPIETGNVSFGSNMALINCPVEALVFIDGKKKGKIPLSAVEGVYDCSTNGNLNLKVPVGEHEFKVEIQTSSGSCYKDSVGIIDVSIDTCIPIFIDIRKLE